jgi:hypothetical protein
MALPEDLRGLRDQTITELTAAHDYYTDTRVAWGLVRRAIASGQRFRFSNRVTGTQSTAADLNARIDGYVSEQLTQATFQQFISTFETFFFDFLRLWLLAYPRSLGRRQLEFKDILDAPDKDAITLLVVNKELNELLYERPAAWFAYLEDKAKLGCPTATEVEQIAEAKASRDVLVHNGGVAGKVYVAKAGKLARYKEGEKIDIPEPYHRQTWELLRKVVADVSNAALTKLP